jgi:hypothetical protein
MRERLELSVEEAPWGHGGLPTVREAARAYPFAAVAAAFIALGIAAVVPQALRLSPPYAVALFTFLAPTAWWLEMYAAIRGWVDFDD